jgi:enterochelin esterase-like enzyme
MWGRYFLILMTLGCVLFTSGCGEDEPKRVTPQFYRLWEDQLLQSEILNQPIQYAVLLPEGYNESDESYPVVYLLHGYGDDETAWYEGGALQYYVDRDIAETVPMIYVMPQAFNSYYIDRYSGSFPYMEMFVEELVPEIDAKFRTKKDRTQRAVMGYSMGGYGALILPAMHPEVFSISIPLSMSFRTDAQYIAESQGSFDNQWAPNFGPARGTSGAARLSTYFKTRSPFYFFDQADVSVYNTVNFLIDCGDDEESLIFTSNSMHSLMRDNNINHEYRVRSGGHSFDYWRKSYPEALRYISNKVRGIQHPAEPTPAEIGALISETEITEVEIGGVTINILKPSDYETTSLEYPVLYVVHDGESNHKQNLIKTFSLLRNSMTTTKIVKSVVVEISSENEVDEDLMEDIVSYVDANYRTKELRANRVIMSNGDGATKTLAIANQSDLFSDCYVFNAELPDAAPAVSETVFYYLDETDKSDSYKGYENLFSKIRNDGTDGYEFRVRQGAESYQAFLNGLNDSFSSLKESLSR